MKGTEAGTCRMCLEKGKLTGGTGTFLYLFCAPGGWVYVPVTALSALYQHPPSTSTRLCTMQTGAVIFFSLSLLPNTELCTQGIFVKYDRIKG